MITMVKKVYYKPDTSIAEERAKELGKVLTFKLKSWKIPVETVLMNYGLEKWWGEEVIKLFR